MSKTTELVEALRCCEHNSCTGCPYIERDSECIGEVMGAAADKIEELTDRCARYAEEIAVLQEKQKWVDAHGGGGTGVKVNREELYRKTVYCPTCRGVTPQGCPRCGGVGLVVVPATRGDVLRRMSDRELAAQLFDFRFDGYAKAQGAETVLPDTIHSIENWLKEEMDE